MKLILFGGAESGQAVAEIKMIGKVINRLQPKQVLHIPFARVMTNEADWTGDWFGRNIVLEGSVYLNAANDEDIVAAQSPLIFMSGGGQSTNLMNELVARPALLELVKNAEYIIGESAGSKILAEYFRYTEPGGPNEMFKGLGIIKDTVIEPHYTERNRQQLLVEAMQKTGIRYGVGIDALTAMEFDLDKFPNEYTKIGDGLIEIRQ